jgi:hypothetical protein
MIRLNSRQKFIPGGFKFYDANLKWTAPNNASFQVICDSLRSARMANPGITAAKGLATDPAAIELEVDFFNASLCEQSGWTDYYTGGSGGAAGAPFLQEQFRPQPNRSKNLVAGTEAIVEWIASGAEAVPQSQSTSRAGVCAACSLNGRGDWTKWFTIPVANAIRAALRHKVEFKLSTPHDAVLGICEACHCVNSLKVHVPLDKFLPKMSQQAKDSLDPKCWIKTEAGNAV